MPKPPVTGSLKIPRAGGTKVNMTKDIPIMNNIMSGSRVQGHFTVSERIRRASNIYAMAAETKNIAIFIQSGDLPITPL